MLINVLSALRLLQLVSLKHLVIYCPHTTVSIVCRFVPSVYNHTNLWIVHTKSHTAVVFFFFFGFSFVQIQRCAGVFFIVKDDRRVIPERCVHKYHQQTCGFFIYRFPSLAWLIWIVIWTDQFLCS